MRTKQTLGIFVDGQFMRLARLKQDEAGITIEALETAKLVESIDSTDEVTESPEDLFLSEPEKEKSPFGFDADGADQNQDTLDVEEAATNFDVLMDVLGKMCPEKCGLAFNLIDSFVQYKEIPSLQQKNKKKAKREVLAFYEEDIEAGRSLDRVGYISRSDGTYLGIVNDDPIELVRLLNDIQRFMRKRPPHVSLIDTAEVALAGAIRTNYELVDDEITAVVFIGNSYSKVFFMRGTDIGFVVPTINKGSSSNTVCEIIFSKMLFEIDSGNIDRIDRFVLVGEVDRVDAENFFSGRFQKCEIERLKFENLQLADALTHLAPELLIYAPAIALALKGLDPKSKFQFNTNFLPDKVREDQSIYRIAWHGNVLLILLFLCVSFLTYQSIQKSQAIHLTRVSLQELEAKIQVLSNVKTELDSIQTAINNLEQNTALLDSLSSVTVRWSPSLEKISEAHDFIGGFQLTKVTNSSPHTLVVEAESNDREKVAKLERFITASNLQSVVRVNEEGDKYLLVTMQREVKAGQKFEKPKEK